MPRVVGGANDALKEQIFTTSKLLKMPPPPHALDFDAWIVCALLTIARKVGDESLLVDSSGKKL